MRQADRGECGRWQLCVCRCGLRYVGIRNISLYYYPMVSGSVRLLTPAGLASMPGLILLAVVRRLLAFGARKKLVPLLVLDGLDPRGRSGRNVGVLVRPLGRRLVRSLALHLDLLRFALRDVVLVGLVEPLELPQASGDALKVAEEVVVAHVVDDRAPRLDEV